jgi:hypothetical protein
MLSDLPPSGAWAGYYVFAHSDLKHRMRLNLTFTMDGNIHGDGVDDVAPFVIEGQFDRTMSAARWTKAYVGMHSVEYSGLYCQRVICGDWTLTGTMGGFWIWPSGLDQSVAEHAEIEEPFQVLKGSFQ